MAREHPQQESPAAKPSITVRQSVHSMGQWINPRATNGTEYGQVTYGGGGKSAGGGAPGKGKFSLACESGGEYRTNTSKG